VKGSIAEIIAPKFDTTAIKIEIKIIGIWKLLEIFNLIV
tara:strand:- start:829 stop:945 length:117 start_codon:yes stop_codon:yes gene_type:complete